ncbi:MAG: LysR family transcriptional regulator [Rhodospirillales bacterium]|jgi:DNA-binding transcriptional LysR family regulator|nr:LysR family transcriptional regulator [Rhodospirillales bacterium]
MIDKASEMAAFVRVVKAGGFSAAAPALGLSPSAVSKLIARLEDRLGARLLNRTTRSVSLTDEGRAFLERARHILAEIEEAEQSVSQHRGAPRGRLRVTAAVAFAVHQIVPLLPEFLASAPEVHVELDVRDRIVDLVEEGFDVGVRTGVHGDSSLISRLVATDHRIICAAPEYLQRHGVPAVPADLLHHNCLTWFGNPGGLNDWPFDGPEGPYSVRVRGNAEVNNGDALYGMTRAGLGLARIARYRIAGDIRAGRLIPLLADHHRFVELPIHIVYPHRRHLSAKVRAFTDFLVSKFTPVPPWAIDAV